MPVPQPGPSAPPLTYSAVRAPAVPTSIRVMTWSFRVAALWTVGSAIAFWWWVRSSIRDVDNAAGTVDAAADLGLEGRPASVVQWVLDRVADDQWRGWVAALAVVLIVLSVLVAVVYLLLGRAVARGSRVARGFATALAVVSLLWLVLGPQAWVWVALGVAGVVAAWRPQSTAYLVAVREGRR